MSSTAGVSFETGLSFPGLPALPLERFAEWRGNGRLGFMQLPFQRGLAASCLELAGAFAGEVDDVIVDGIGGSALGARCLLSALGPGSGPRVRLVDSPDHRTVDAVKEACNPARTLLVVITKSGSTAETMSVLLSLYPWLPAGIRDRRTVAVTDPSSGDLRKLADDRGWASLPIPPSVGGRYSVLSPAGLLPAAFAGLDIPALLDGAADVIRDFDLEGTESLAGRLAACWLAFFESHPVHVFFAYSDRFFDVALWFSQLWAESLGKRRPGGGAGLGQTPLACRGPADQHSLVQLFMEGPADKFFTFLDMTEPSPPLPGGFEGYPSAEWLTGRTLDELRRAESSATSAALAERGLPVCRLHAGESPSEKAVGALLAAMEIATVLTGLALGIDPLDQPGVERGKHLTFAGMGRPGWQ
ncbi:MAG: glucose-6-phosphate isomerase [Candidatus Fermentibacter sp.]|nr:glucose-6-phosphate isomerase [Candidatus Fermentibacter sp.]